MVQNVVTGFSGPLQHNDVLILQTHDFATKIPLTTLRENIATSNISEMAENLAPLLHEGATGAEAAIADIHGARVLEVQGPDAWDPAKQTPIVDSIVADKPDALLKLLPTVFRLRENIGLPESVPIRFLADDHRAGGAGHGGRAGDGLLPAGGGHAAARTRRPGRIQKVAELSREGGRRSRGQGSACYHPLPSWSPEPDRAPCRDETSFEPRPPALPVLCMPSLRAE